MNIKFIVEGMEEAGSPALEELVRREKDRFFSGVDYIVISDNLWISQRKPALIYGTRGNSYFTVEVPANLGVCREEASRGSEWKAESALESRGLPRVPDAWPWGLQSSWPPGGWCKPPRALSRCASCLFLGGGLGGVGGDPQAKRLGPAATWSGGGDSSPTLGVTTGQDRSGRPDSSRRALSCPSPRPAWTPGCARGAVQAP